MTARDLGYTLGWAVKSLTRKPGAGRPFRSTEVPMMCGVYYKPFIVMAELRGYVCFFVENKLPSPEEIRDRRKRGFPMVGYFQFFDAHPDWRCPHCGARDNRILNIHLLWVCSRTLMCTGSVGRGAYWSNGSFSPDLTRWLSVPRGDFAERRSFVHGAPREGTPAEVRAAIARFGRYKFGLTRETFAEPSAELWGVFSNWDVWWEPSASALRDQWGDCVDDASALARAK
jgi:hypothetical protein